MTTTNYQYTVARAARVDAEKIVQQFTLQNVTIDRRYEDQYVYFSTKERTRQPLIWGVFLSLQTGLDLLLYFDWAEAFRLSERYVVAQMAVPVWYVDDVNVSSYISRRMKFPVDVNRVVVVKPQNKKENLDLLLLFTEKHNAATLAKRLVESADLSLHLKGIYYRDYYGPKAPPLREAHHDPGYAIPWSDMRAYTTEDLDFLCANHGPVISRMPVVYSQPKKKKEEPPKPLCHVCEIETSLTDEEVKEQVLFDLNDKDVGLLIQPASKDNARAFDVFTYPGSSARSVAVLLETQAESNSQLIGIARFVYANETSARPPLQETELGRLLTPTELTRVMEIEEERKRRAAGKTKKRKIVVTPAVSRFADIEDATTSWEQPKGQQWCRLFKFKFANPWPWAPSEIIRMWEEFLGWTSFVGQLNVRNESALLNNACYLYVVPEEAESAAIICATADSDRLPGQILEWEYRNGQRSVTYDYEKGQPGLVVLQLGGTAEQDKTVVPPAPSPPHDNLAAKFMAMRNDIRADLATPKPGLGMAIEDDIIADLMRTDPKFAVGVAVWCRVLLLSSTLPYPALKSDMDVVLMGRGDFVLRSLSLISGYYFLYAQSAYTESITRAFVDPVSEHPWKAVTFYHTNGARRGFYSVSSGPFGLPVQSIEADANNLDVVRGEVEMSKVLILSEEERMKIKSPNPNYKAILDAHSKHHIPIVTGTRSGFSIDDICPWCNKNTVGYKSAECNHRTFCTACHFKYVQISELWNVCPVRSCLLSPVKWMLLPGPAKESPLPPSTVTVEEVQLDEEIINETLRSDLEALGVHAFSNEDCNIGKCKRCGTGDLEMRTTKCHHPAFCYACYLYYKESTMATICPAGDCLKRDIDWVKRAEIDIVWSTSEAAADKLKAIHARRNTPARKPNPGYVAKRVPPPKDKNSFPYLVYLRGILADEMNMKPEQPDGSTGYECARCFFESAVWQAKPCDHMTFCEECLPLYMEQAEQVEPELCTRCPRFSCLQADTRFMKTDFYIEKRMPILPDDFRRKQEKWDIPLDEDEKAIQAAIDGEMHGEDPNADWLVDDDMMQESYESSGELDKSAEEEVDFSD